MPSPLDNLMDTLRNGDDFVPENAIEFLRGRDTPEDHLIADLVEGLWDYISELKVKQEAPKPSRRKRRKK